MELQGANAHGANLVGRGCGEQFLWSARRLAIGGYDSGLLPLRNVEAYNYATNSWTRNANLPSGGTGSGSQGAVTIRGKIYVPGGKPDGRRLYVYDPPTNSWSTAASTPIPVGRGMSVAINDKLYVFIGSGTAFPYVDSSLGRRLYRYDPSTNTWTQRAASPDYHGEGIAAAIGGKLYLMGGRDESDLSDDYDVPSLVVTVYDPATNRWTTLQGGAKGDNSSAGTAFQSELWDLGGNPYGPDLEITAAVKAYDPVTGTLSTKAPMLTERWGAAAVKVAYRGTARLLVLGGGSNTLWAVRTVERYTP